MTTRTMLGTEGNYRQHRGGAGTKVGSALYFDAIEPDVIRLTIHFKNGPVSYAVGVAQLEQALDTGRALPEHDNVHISLANDGTVIIFTLTQERASISFDHPENFRRLVGQARYCVAHPAHVATVEEGFEQLEAYLRRNGQ